MGILLCLLDAILFQTSLFCIICVFLSSANTEKNRLLSGTYAKRGQFPYTVTIINKENKIFGGSLISTNVVLTSAADIAYRDPFMVYMGTVEARNPNNLEGIVVNTSNYRAHKYFDSVDHENDIALLFLPGHFFIRGLIEPIRLPAVQKYATSYYEGQIATLSGVGVTNKYNKENMQFILLRVITNQECKKYWKLSDLFETQFCTQSRGNEISPCHGDQGGPLTIKEEDGLETQIGISSLFNCGRDYPHIYTKLIDFVEWIAQNGGPPLRKAKRRYKSKI